MYIFYSINYEILHIEKNSFKYLMQKNEQNNVYRIYLVTKHWTEFFFWGTLDWIVS